jgi:hypothetical protein
MRRILIALAFLAVPALVEAQQPDADIQEAAPTIQLEESVPGAPTLEAVDVDAPAPQLPAVESSRADQPADAQEGGPATREWWWLVGAIVAGGIILAILL